MISAEGLTPEPKIVLHEVYRFWVELEHEVEDRLPTGKVRIKVVTGNNNFAPIEVTVYEWSKEAKSFESVTDTTQ